MPSAAAISGYLWAAWVAYWLIAARDTKPTEYSQPALHRSLHYAGMIVAFALLYGAGARSPRLFQPGVTTDAIGLGLQAIGLVLSVWARMRLGRNWSGVVMLKTGHELITDGPYRLTRHPIYTGLLLGFLGSWLIVATIAGVLGFGVLFASVLWKSSQEEALMRRAFPDLYPAYATRVSRIIPGIF